MPRGSRGQGRPLPQMQVILYPRKDLQKLASLRPKHAGILSKVRTVAEQCVTSMQEADTMETWAQSYGVSEENEEFAEIEELCGTICRNLRTLRAQYIPPTYINPDINQLCAYRDKGQTLYLLEPIEAFKANQSIKNKTFGFVREEGTYHPQMCAISGSTKIINAHGDSPEKIKMLDSPIWAEEVRRLMKWLGAPIPNSRWEIREARKHSKKGLDICGHVEPKLMLWYAVDRLEKLTGSQYKTIKEKVAKIHRLSARDVEPSPNAEIFLDHDYNCSSCLRYQTHIEELTGIKFHFKSMTRVGKVERGQDKYKNTSFSEFASEDHLESSNEETEEEVDHQELQLALSKTSNKHHLSTVNKHKSRKAQDVVISTKSMISRIQSFRYDSTDRNVENHWHHPKKPPVPLIVNDDSDDSDFAPRPNSKRARNENTPDRRISTRTNGLPTPPDTIDNPFAGIIKGAKSFGCAKKRRSCEDAPRAKNSGPLKKKKKTQEASPSVVRKNNKLSKL